MNEYVIRVIFLDEDEYELESMIFNPVTESLEDAYDEIDDAIENDPNMYPSEQYETILLDVC